MRWSLFSALFFAVAGLVLTAEGKDPSCGAPTCAAPNCAAPNCAAPTCSAEPTCGAPSSCAAQSGCASGCCGGSDCCGKGCKGCGKGCGCKFCRGYEGLDRHFNCGCNGSFKYPVPPLYTYHWPGMYSLQLMTDYHSPWRYPPIKPYTDEHLQPYPSGVGPDQEALPPAPPSMTRTNPPAGGAKEVQNAEYSTSTQVVPGNAEAISNKLKRVSRYLP